MKNMDQVKTLFFLFSYKQLYRLFSTTLLCGDAVLTLKKKATFFCNYFLLFHTKISLKKKQNWDVLLKDGRKQNWKWVFEQ